MFVQRSIDIAAPPEAVWAVVEGVERWPSWTVTMTSVERLDSGPFRVGSRARVRQPRLLPATWTVTQHDPPHAFTWETTSPGLRMVAGHRVEAIPGGARVTLEVNSSGLLAALVDIVFGKLGTSYVETEAASLKRYVEAGTPAQG